LQKKSTFFFEKLFRIMLVKFCSHRK
jgi:hypothetical protein